MNSNSTSNATGPSAQERRGGIQACNFGSRGLTLATFVIALAGFAGTAFSAVPAEMFGQPAACIVSH